ncbi:adenine-specific methyltransferase EcoRI family protein [Mycoplasma sp. VS299A]|uniref:adenine-specific methyltransferase EcoRI family protein n=1 Tax=unclassified Mycoplasma TaxID=2683645 RepID=UPI003AAFD479
MHSAKNAKNDEFYTQYDDIAKELNHYKEQLKGKNILCPCDFDFYLLSEDEKKIIQNGKLLKQYNDGFNFSRFLRAKEEIWNLNLTFSSYNPQTNEGIPFQESIKEFAKKHPNGIIITNPPFSLFREFIQTIIECNLKFLIIGNKNAITYKEVFKYIKEDKLWLGYTSAEEFIQPDSNEPKNIKGLTRWFTNLDVEPRHQRLILTEKYNPQLYPTYDNYNAINVDKVKDIPCDYSGYIGVPITFLDKYNPKQFEIIALGIVGSIDFTKDDIKMECLDKNGNFNGKYTTNAKGTLYTKYTGLHKKAFRDTETGEYYSSHYARVIIRNKLVRKDN